MNPQIGMVNPGVTERGNPYVRNLSDVDLGASMGGVTARGGLNVQFFYQPVRTRAGTVDVRLCIAKQPKGDPKTIAVTQITEQEAIREFPREFAMFKEYAEAPSTGTPLHELPGATQSEIAFLTVHGLRSIEDLADLSPEIASQIGFEAVNAQKRAKFWMARNASGADVIDAAKIAADSERRIAELSRQVDALTKRNLELEAVERALATSGARATSGMQARAEGGVMMVDSGADLPPLSDDEDGALAGYDTSADDDLDLDSNPDPLRNME